MTEVKHTEGPWVAINGKYGYQIHSQFDTGRGHWMANMKCESCPVQEEANAHLIAAAPDMEKALEVVKQACLFVDDDGSVGVAEDVVIPADLFNQICAALAKARGEEK